MRFARSSIACLLLSTTYLVVLVVAGLGHALRRRRATFNGCILVTGTFYNRNWFLSHAIPLGRSGANDVIVVADEPQQVPLPIRVVCPPRWLSLPLGRAASKLIWMMVMGLRYRPDIYMGFHIFPGAISALMVARLLGRSAVYQMTGGPVEVVGGGVFAENILMKNLLRPFPFLERLAVAVTRRFDLVVVRGSKAKSFLAERGVARTCVIPGSIEPVRFDQRAERFYDLVFVGRLTEIKQPGQFVEIVARVRRSIPSIRAALVGGGPLLDSVREQSRSLGIEDCLDILGKHEDVGDILARSKIFVLTSRSEGLSIAMMEAMAAGLPAIVADVGELGDLVLEGETGWLVTPDRIEEYSSRIVTLLSDESLRNRLSARAREIALDYASLDRVTERWTRAFNDLLENTGSKKAKPSGSVERVGTHAA